MDAASSISNSDVDKLNEKDKSELRQFISNQLQVSQIQNQTHALTELCWRKCVTSSIRAPTLDKAEDGCLTNCVQRFLDVNFLTMKHMQQMSNTR